MQVHKPPKNGLLRLKLNEPLPILIGPPCGTSILLPKRISAFAEIFVKGAIPILLGAALWTSVLFPKRVSAFTNGVLKTNFCFRIALHIVAVRRHLAASTNVDSSGQAS